MCVWLMPTNSVLIQTGASLLLTSKYFTFLHQLFMWFITTNPPVSYLQNYIVYIVRSFSRSSSFYVLLNFTKVSLKYNWSIHEVAAVLPSHTYPLQGYNLLELPLDLPFITPCHKCHVIPFPYIPLDNFEQFLSLPDLSTCPTLTFAQ